MITFRADGKEYSGLSALEIVGCLSKEEASFLDKQLSVRELMLQSLAKLSGCCIRMREVDMSVRLDDEMFALGYLYLRDEYGAGALVGAPLEKAFSRIRFKPRRGLEPDFYQPDKCHHQLRS